MCEPTVYLHICYGMTVVSTAQDLPSTAITYVSTGTGYLDTSICGTPPLITTPSILSAILGDLTVLLLGMVGGAQVEGRKLELLEFRTMSRRIALVVLVTCRRLSTSDPPCGSCLSLTHVRLELAFAPLACGFAEHIMWFYIDASSNNSQCTTHRSTVYQFCTKSTILSCDLGEQSELEEACL